MASKSYLLTCLLIDSVNCLFREQVEIKAYDGGEGNHFGYSVDIWNNTAVVSAPYEDNSTGGVYVFIYNEDSTVLDWYNSDKLTANDGQEGDFFGSSVAIWEDIIVIGASNDNVGGNYSGSAYIFQRYENNNTFRQICKIAPSITNKDDYFGYHVTIYNNTIVVSAYGYENSDASFEAGFVTVFEKDAEGNDHECGWNETAILEPSGGSDNDKYSFGKGITIYENTIIVGSPFEDHATFGTDAGAVYVFEKNEMTGNWEEVQKLTSSDGANNDEFGFSVSVWDNTLVTRFPAHLLLFSFEPFSYFFPHQL